MSDVSLLSQLFRKRVAETKDFNMINEANEDIGYPTGYLNFDFLNGYITYEFDASTGQKKAYYSTGLTDGSYVAFIGNTGTGKTTLICQMAANIVRPFKTSTIFEDSLESGLTHARRRSLSGFSDEEYKNRYIIRNSGITAENVYERIKMIHDLKVSNPDQFLYDTGHKDSYGNPIMKFEPTIYIIDSIAMLMPKKYTEEDELAGKSMGPASALIITSVFRSILPMLKAANIILFGINHILEDVQLTAMPKKQIVPYLKQGERLPKGRTITFLANNIIRIENQNKLKKDEGYKIEGSVTSVQILKSRSSGNKMATNLIFDFDNGFDPWLSLLRFMQDNKLIQGSGVSMYFDDEKKYKFSQANFLEQIKTNPEFRNAFLAAVLPHLKAIPAQRDVIANSSYIGDLLSTPDIFAA